MTIPKQIQYYEISFALFAKLNSGLASFDDVLRCFERGVRLEKSLRKALRETYANSIAEEGTWNELLDTARDLFSKEPHLLLNLVSNFFRIALINKPLAQRDDALIRIACNRFSFPPQAYQRLRKEFDPSYEIVDSSETKVENPRKVSERCKKALEFLGCSPADTISEIKTSYRQLARLYHPDMHAADDTSKNLGEEIRQGFLSLQRAYEVVKQEYRFD